MVCIAPFTPGPQMARPFNPDLTKNWKVCLPAPLAARVELALFDKNTKKPAYGDRGKVIAEMFELWLDHKLPSISIQPKPPTP
jgi:hypothetical protein